jgi:hypothetical protein
LVSTPLARNVPLFEEMEQANKDWQSADATATTPIKGIDGANDRQRKFGIAPPRG